VSENVVTYVLADSNKHCYADFTDRPWFEFQRRGISSLGQATKASADPQKEALISRSDDNVGGQGQTLPSQLHDGNLKLTSEEEVRKFFVLYSRVYSYG